MAKEKKASIFNKIMEWINHFIAIQTLVQWVLAAGLVAAFWGKLRDMTEWFKSDDWLSQVAMDIGLVLILLAIILMVVGLVIRLVQKWKHQGTSATVSASVVEAIAQPVPLVHVYDRHFKNETVIVDGKHFVNCTFDSCTIRYDGGEYDFTNSKAILHKKGPTMKFKSGTLAIGRAWDLFNQFALARKGDGVWSAPEDPQDLKKQDI